LRGEALGIVETTTVAAVIDAADAGVKAADVEVSSQ
jgi:microcompartment protein CcmL/EutN